MDCTTVRADLTTDDGIEELFAAAGELTGVVNNAGATLHLGRSPTPRPTSYARPWTSTSPRRCWWLGPRSA